MSHFDAMPNAARSGLPGAIFPPKHFGLDSRRNLLYT
jgi:hypothetical protein